MHEHPVTLHVYDDLRRSRLTVFFRPFLCFPHFFWFGLWSIAVLPSLFANWLVALIIGRPSYSLNRFFSAYLRYWSHLLSFLLLIANPFPGFLGKRGWYPVELELPVWPDKQRRLGILIRAILVYPAFLIAVLGVEIAVYPVALLAWVVGLLTGRMPRGFRDLGANAIRYLGQVLAYLFLITGRYPSASPYVGMSLGFPVGAGPAAGPAGRPAKT